MLQVIDKAPWLEPSEIEFRAQTLLRDYEEQFGVIASPPVPIERIIEKKLDLAIEWAELEDEPGEMVLGCIDPGEHTIRLNERHLDHFQTYFGSEAFTLAHETGHWVLHVQETFATQLSMFDALARKPFICRVPTKGKLSSFEWQANQFAAALLLPKPLLRDFASQISLCSWPVLYQLKDTFGVTITTLKNRLADLNMLYVDKDGQLYPSREACGGQQHLHP